MVTAGRWPGPLDFGPIVGRAPDRFYGAPWMAAELASKPNRSRPARCPSTVPGIWQIEMRAGVVCGAYDRWLPRFLFGRTTWGGWRVQFTRLPTRHRNWPAIGTPWVFRDAFLAAGRMPRGYMAKLANGKGGGVRL